jgi:FxsC-like protein
MSHWFFLSYARNDRDDCLGDFYRDLNKEIREWAGPEAGEDGFFDENDIELGKHWSPALTEALQDCRAFIALCSPAYFNSEICGREWQFFSERQTAYSASLAPPASSPSLMMPVLWLPENKLKPLPEAVAAVQYKHSDFGDIYAREGLKRLIQYKKYKEHYRNFLRKFASKLCRAARDHALPPHPHLLPINKIESAFHQRSARTSDNGGPRVAQFVFVAGRRDELKAAGKKKLDAYGDEGECDWHPYLPDVPQEVEIIAQGIATEENFRYVRVQLDDNFIKRIEEAEQDNRIVAILVDSWTLGVPRYERLIKKYNHCNFVNCAVLAPLNDKDDETKDKWSDLFGKVRSTFVNHYVNRNPSCFLVVSSYDELKDGLRTALHKARTRLIERAEVMRRAEGDRFISKPII